MNQQRIARMYEQKKFFATVYNTELAELGNFKDGQCIRVFKANGDYSKVDFFNNIDDLVRYTTKNDIYRNNMYFTLATTNGAGGTKQDLKTRTVLAFDFDKKDLGQDFNHIDIINRFKAIGLWYHILVDSGHGYHAYTCIEPTQEHDKVAEVTQAIASRLGADMNATKTTQILRVPHTFNVKDKPKQVNIIYMYPEEKIKRYDIERLYKRYCLTVQQEGTGGKATQFIINNTNIPYCITKMLKEGSKDGTRYEDLQKIVVTLRNRNKSLAEIQAICEEWNEKSDYNDNLDYRVEHIFNNRKYVSMDCKGCEHYKECYSRVESDFNFPDDANILKMTETHTRHLREPRRKGAKVMTGNDLLVYGILKNHSDGLFRAEIERELTYNGKTRLSNKTLSNALNNLEDNGFITVDRIGRKKFYKAKEIRSKVELTYKISYAATYECVKNNITTEELRLYNYMRYLHNKQQREDPKALKGNLFYFNQRDLAKEMGVTQGRISQMINNLLNEKLLGIWYRQPSQNNGFDYYIYRLNY
jgi:DNA-binding MarR family transcriptional regulator